MNLQDQVCTLKQAKRLMVLGVRQDVSHAAWLRNECHDEKTFWCWPVEAQGISNKGYSAPAKGCLEGFSAFSVAELGLMLGSVQPPQKSTHGLLYWYDIIGDRFRKFETEALARAELVIHLLEKGATTAEEINERLKSA
jgi:hypothetical protein